MAEKKLVGTIKLRKPICSNGITPEQLDAYMREKSTINGQEVCGVKGGVVKLLIFGEGWFELSAEELYTIIKDINFEIYDGYKLRIKKE